MSKKSKLKHQDGESGEFVFEVLDVAFVLDEVLTIPVCFGYQVEQMNKKVNHTWPKKLITVRVGHFSLKAPTKNIFWLITKCFDVRLCAVIPRVGCLTLKTVKKTVEKGTFQIVEHSFIYCRGDRSVHRCQKYIDLKIGDRSFESAFHPFHIYFFGRQDTPFT